MGGESQRLLYRDSSIFQIKASRSYLALECYKNVYSRLKTRYGCKYLTETNKQIERADRFYRTMIRKELHDGISMVTEPD